MKKNIQIKIDEQYSLEICIFDIDKKITRI